MDYSVKKSLDQLKIMNVLVENIKDYGKNSNRKEKEKYRFVCRHFKKAVHYGCFTR